MQQIHFIAGLPRSGSTLLAAILRQNPTFSAGMSSPVAMIFNQMLVATSRKNEAASMITVDHKKRLLKSIFTSYYEDHDGVVFDTNRIWPAKITALMQLFPESRIICCVRELGWILDSFERQVRNNPFDLSGIYGFDVGGTVVTRSANLTSNSGLVGFALDAIREAYFGEYAKQLILVEYEALTKLPSDLIKMLYGLLDLPPFEHDFNNVEYNADEFDIALGSPGLHTVKKKVEYVERQTILPPNLFNSMKQQEFWRDPAANKHDVTVISY